MFADVHPKARRDKQRYKASSSGVPDVVDEEQPTLYEGYTRVAVPRPAGDDVACCVPKLATERDDRSFARLLRRRCILPYWFLLVFVRVAETSGQYLQTGGRGRGRDLDGFFRVRVDGRVRGAAGRPARRGQPRPVRRRRARAPIRRIALPMAFYMLSIVLSNAVIYMVATPLWLRARAMEDARLERRADELDAAMDFVVWQWRFDTMELRRAATAPSSSASISSSLVEEMQGGNAPKGSNAPKALGAVPLAGSPSSLGSARGLDLDGTP
ncbi:hypothetical protein JL721_3084 [Aureococcus anophagefferens]|nr:hypothetical protein JL721_3084 [Aureococcus anophagefferens]